MKYVDIQRLRWGYVFVFAMAVLLMLGAILDAQIGNESHMPWFIAGLASLVVLAALYYGSTQLILRDALSLTPVAAPSAIPPAPVEAPVEVRANAGLGEKLRAAPVAITESRPRAESVPVTVVRPAPVPRPASAPAPEPLARPQHVPAPPKGVIVQPVAFESGDPNFRPAARGAPSKPKRGNLLAQTRILCQGCSYYFQAFLEDVRPAAVSCPRCNLELGLSGARQTTDHVKVRCRHCGEFLWAPRVGRNVALQCATCGQSSE